LAVKNKYNPHDLNSVRIDFLMAPPNEDLIFNKIGGTETMNIDAYIPNGTFPFDTNFYMDYYFERHQHIKIEIYYKDNKVDTIQTTLGRIMGAKFNQIEFNMREVHNITLIVKAIPIKEEVEDLIVSFDIFADMSGLPYSDYFVLLSNTLNEGTEQKIWKSEEMTGKDFTFVANDLHLYDICRGDMDKEIIFDFYRVYYGLMCRIKTSLRQIANPTKEEQFVLESIQKETKIGFCKISYNTLSSLRFIDYIESGLQISLVVGIDFTSSNGNPNDIRSLHYVYGSGPNNYEHAIRSCGSIVAYYDLDKSFPVHGFGAVIPGNSNTNHCFSVNFRENASVDGIDGIIHAYKKCLGKVQLDGPTYFSPLVKNMIKYVKYQETKSISSVYYIMLILTDGQIHDMQQTKDMIVEAAKLPISIIIIGIGDDNFANMIELDGDKVAIKNKKGEKCLRDIVQFVRYNDFKSNSINLSEEVLKEVPKQVEQFYRLNKKFRSLTI
jgi:hypothetical protein